MGKENIKEKVFGKFYDVMIIIKKVEVIGGISFKEHKINNQSSSCD